MKVLFCKVSGMKYYKGACEQDIPYNGGKFVEENGFGHEEFNFLPIDLEGAENEMCLGYVEPKSNRGTRNTIHIEKIDGCHTCKKEDAANDVLVIWCATMENLLKNKRGGITVVGWYKHATVFREPQNWTMIRNDGSEDERFYNVLASADDCTLLPEGERNRFDWYVPNARYTRSFGFGQSMLWYPTEETAKDYLGNLLRNIDKYDGENWLNRYPEI